MALETYLKTKDYSVSKEKFELLLDDRVDLLITNPRPKKENLGKYYETENYISHTLQCTLQYRISYFYLLENNFLSLLYFSQK